MPLKDLVTRELVTCYPEASVREAAELMREKDIGSILIVDTERRPLGILTDRDIVLRCVCEESDCQMATVEDIMTQGVETVSVDEGVYNVIEAMKKNEIRRLPVVDKDGKAVGLLSFGDMLKLLTEELSDLAAGTVPEKAKIIDQAA